MAAFPQFLPPIPPSVLPSRPKNMTIPRVCAALATFTLYCALAFAPAIHAQTNDSQSAAVPRAIVLHAARLLDVETGRISTPGEILVQGGLIVEVGSKVNHPHNSELIDLGDTTLLPGLI